jgi:hypothetical protein
MREEERCAAGLHNYAAVGSESELIHHRDAFSVVSFPQFLIQPPPCLLNSVIILKADYVAISTAHSLHHVLSDLTSPVILIL